MGNIVNSIETRIIMILQSNLYYTNLTAPSIPFVAHSLLGNTNVRVLYKKLRFIVQSRDIEIIKNCKRFLMKRMHKKNNS